MQMSGPAFVRFVFCRRSNRFDFWPSPEKPGVSGLQVVAGELPTSGKRSRTARKPSLPTNEHRQLWVGPNTAILRFSTPDRRMHFPNRPRKKTLRRILPDRGRESSGSPSLRTGQALFTHPALRLMGSNSETEVFEF